MANPQLNIDAKIVNLNNELNRIRSIIKRNAHIDFSINSRSFTQPLGRITASADEFTKSIEASNARVLAFGASVGIMNAVANGMKGLVEQSVKLQKALADINVITNTTKKNLAQIGQTMFKVAKDTGQSMDDVVVSMLEFSRQGLTAEETAQRTSDAMILMRLTGVDAKKAVDGLTASINSFVKAGISSSEILNKVSSVDVQFAISADNIVEAVSRVGSVAEDAGLSFDQLVGAVTAAQQITARGGAVIGNSFKTIFTRIQRSSTLDALEGIGIAVRDIEGNTLPAIEILKELATTFDKLSDSQQSSVAEQVGGVFQINVLKASLKDLGSANSVYERATRIASEATDEAIKKNEQLNQTIDALANEAVVSLQELAAVLGQSVFGRNIESILKSFNNFVESLSGNIGDGESSGASFGNSFAAGLSSAVKPLVIALSVILAKLGVKAFSFAKKSFQDFLGLNDEAKKFVDVQRSVFSSLQNNAELSRRMKLLEGDKVAQAKLFLSEVELVTRQFERQNQLTKEIAASLVTQGAFYNEDSDSIALGGKRSKYQRALTRVTPAVLAQNIPNNASPFAMLRSVLDKSKMSGKVGRENFEGVNDAINRELAAGIPSSAIRVHKSARMKSSSNPSGLVVTNTIDEPNGISDVYRKSKDRSIPNFADRAPQSGLGSLLRNIGLARPGIPSIPFLGTRLRTREVPSAAKKLQNEAAMFDDEISELVESLAKMNESMDKILNNIVKLENQQNKLQQKSGEINAKKSGAVSASKKLEVERSGIYKEFGSLMTELERALMRHSNKTEKEARQFSKNLVQRRVHGQVSTTATDLNLEILRLKGKRFAKIKAGTPAVEQAEKIANTGYATAKAGIFRLLDDARSRNPSLGRRIGGHKSQLAQIESELSSIKGYSREDMQKRSDLMQRRSDQLKRVYDVAKGDLNRSEKATFRGRIGFINQSSKGFLDQKAKLMSSTDPLTIQINALESVYRKLVKNNEKYLNNSRKSTAVSENIKKLDLKNAELKAESNKLERKKISEVEKRLAIENDPEKKKKEERRDELLDRRRDLESALEDSHSARASAGNFALAISSVLVPAMIDAVATEIEKDRLKGEQTTRQRAVVGGLRGGQDGASIAALFAFMAPGGVMVKAVTFALTALSGVILGAANNIKLSSADVREVNAKLTGQRNEELALAQKALQAKKILDDRSNKTELEVLKAQRDFDDARLGIKSSELAKAFDSTKNSVEDMNKAILAFSEQSLILDRFGEFKASNKTISEQRKKNIFSQFKTPLEDRVSESLKFANLTAGLSKNLGGNSLEDVRNRFNQIEEFVENNKERFGKKRVVAKREGIIEKVSDVITIDNKLIEIAKTLTESFKGNLEASGLDSKVAEEAGEEFYKNLTERFSKASMNIVTKGIDGATEDFRFLENLYKAIVDANSEGDVSAIEIKSKMGEIRDEINQSIFEYTSRIKEDISADDFLSRFNSQKNEFDNIFIEATKGKNAVIKRNFDIKDQQSKSNFQKEQKEFLSSNLEAINENFSKIFSDLGSKNQLGGDLGGIFRKNILKELQSNPQFGASLIEDLFSDSNEKGAVNKLFKEAQKEELDRLRLLLAPVSEKASINPKSEIGKEGVESLGADFSSLTNPKTTFAELEQIIKSKIDSVKDASITGDSSSFKVNLSSQKEAMLALLSIVETLKSFKINLDRQLILNQNEENIQKKREDLLNQQAQIQSKFRDAVTVLNNKTQKEKNRANELTSILDLQAASPRFKLGGLAEEARQRNIRLQKRQIQSNLERRVNLNNFEADINKAFSQFELLFALDRNTEALNKNTEAHSNKGDSVPESGLDKKITDLLSKSFVDVPFVKQEISKLESEFGKKVVRRRINEKLVQELRSEFSGRFSGSVEDMRRQGESILNRYGVAEDAKSRQLLDSMISANNRINNAESDRLEKDRITEQEEDFRDADSESLTRMREGYRNFRNETTKNIEGFAYKLGNEVPSLFRDGMVDAMQAVMNNADNLRDTLLGIANSFLQTIQRSFLTQAADQFMGALPFNSGGVVPSKGKMVPARVSAGEYLMSRAAVQNMGVGAMDAINAGTYPVQGFASGGSVGTKSRDAYAKHLRLFGTSFTNEKSSRFFSGLWEQVPKAQKEVALKNAAEQEAKSASDAKNANKEQLKRSIFGTILSAGLSYGVGKLGDLATQRAIDAAPKVYTSGYTQNAYNGGMIHGPAGRDVIPAMLSEGEYVIKQSAVKKYGKRFLDGINSGKKFFEGGSVSGGSSTSGSGQEINFNMSFDVSSSQTESESKTGSGKEGQNEEGLAQFANNVKRLVQEEIRNEQRAGGLLSPSNGNFRR